MLDPSVPYNGHMLEAVLRMVEAAERNALAKDGFSDAALQRSHEIDANCCSEENES